MAHIDRFIGSWYERWFLYEEDGQRNVTRMEVKLKGSWEDNLPAAR